MPTEPRRKGRVWYADRWLGSSAYLFLTLAEQGAYRNLLDQMHLRGGVLPDDDAVLERASGCRSPAEWAGLKGNVLAHFVRVPEGYRNEAADEIERQAELVRNRQAKYRGSHGDSPRDVTRDDSVSDVTSRVKSRVDSRVPLTHTPTLAPAPPLAPAQPPEGNPSSPPAAVDVKRPPRQKPPPPPEAIRLAKGLLDSIRSHTPGFVGPASLDGWGREIDLILRIDGKTSAEVEAAIAYAHGDPRGSFWRPNVLSGEKLRVQMDRLLIQMHQNGKSEAKPGGGMTTKQILEYGRRHDQNGSC